MEPGMFTDSTETERKEAWRQLRELQRQLGINPALRPRPGEIEDEYRFERSKKR
jgi:hypothetical protein